MCVCVCARARVCVYVRVCCVCVRVLCVCVRVCVCCVCVCVHMLAIPCVYLVESLSLQYDSSLLTAQRKSVVDPLHSGKKNVK